MNTYAPSFCVDTCCQLSSLLSPEDLNCWIKWNRLCFKELANCFPRCCISNFPCVLKIVSVDSLRVLGLAVCQPFSYTLSYFILVKRKKLKSTLTTAKEGLVLGWDIPSMWTSLPSGMTWNLHLSSWNILVQVKLCLPLWCPMLGIPFGVRQVKCLKNAFPIWPC